jgi:uncharacterized protein (TIGR03435 family)
MILDFTLRRAGGMLIVLAAAPMTFAQATASPAADIGHSPTFAVSVVRPSNPESTRSIKFLPGGRFIAQGATVRLLTKIAYSLNDDELAGGPAWIGLKRFDVDATPDMPEGSGVDMASVHLRLQSLLADRFHLQLRDEMKTMSTFALVVAKGGPKLKKSQTQDAPMQAQGNIGELNLTNATMDQLANAVSDWVGHPVLNQTALSGKYDLRLEWTPDQPTASANGSPDSSASLPNGSGPTIFTAVQQQLGLSLQSRKNQALCKVVENVQLPTEN